MEFLNQKNENIKKITRICMPTGAIGDFYSYDDIVWRW
jgi:hypothetical protein